MKKTQQDKAYEHILENIIAGKYQPGVALREDKIAEDCGFSSTPVREAFRRLEMEGWLERHPYRGSFLREFPKEEVNELYLLREVMEGVAVKLAAKSATDEDLKNMEDALRKEKEFLDSLDNENGSGVFDPPMTSDIEFHKALFKASHSSRLLQQLTALSLQLRCIILSSPLKLSFAQIEDVYEQHCSIYNAIRRGWDDVAEALARKHVLAAGTRIMERYDEIRKK